MFIWPELSIRVIEHHDGFLARQVGSKQGLLHAVQAAAFVQAPFIHRRGRFTIDPDGADPCGVRVYVVDFCSAPDTRTEGGIRCVFTGRY